MQEHNSELPDEADGFALLLPPLSGEQYQALKADIAAHGVLAPVHTDEDGTFIDGRNRKLIADELGVDYEVVIVPGLTADEKIERMLALNLKRRQNTIEQRAELCRKLRKRGWTTTRIAEAMGVSAETVRRDLGDAVSSEVETGLRVVGKDGKSYPARKPSVIAKNRAEAERASAAISKLGPDAASLLPSKTVDVKRVERIARDHAAANRIEGEDITPLPDGLDLRLGDFRELLADLPNDSVRLVLTDFPYTEQFLPLWRDAGAFAARILEPGGFLVTYAGQFYLPREIAALEEFLSPVWTIAVIHQSATTAIHAYHINSRWKPILVYGKPPLLFNGWWRDVLEERKPEKDLHPWQQNVAEAKYLIEAFTKPGDLVVDPCMGSGTVAVAARDTGRRFIGAEIDPRWYVAARGRLEGRKA